MKKWSIALLALGAGLNATAQEIGMHFEHGTTWKQVLAKAKAENKYIFIDCYTTWCGPCKQMSKNIFPMETVGAFYNKNFINIKVQLDTLKDKDGKILDNEEVKNWYATGDMLEAEYNVRAYPTYLFFDPNGNIVHRAVGSSEAPKFISKGEDAMVPEKQYYTLKRKYEAGNHEEKFLYTLAKAANEGYDQPFSKTISAEYLSTQKDLLTKENISFLAENINSSKDKGFTELLNNPEVFDKALGYAYAQNTIRNVILRDEVLPVISPIGQKVNDNPNWNAASKAASTKYPKYGPEAVAYYKISFYKRKADWKNFGPAVTEYMKMYGSSASPTDMNSFAWTVFQNCDDMACVASALDWSKKSFADNNEHQFMDTYANLLYKAGKKKEAIEWETKAMELASKNKEDVGDYKETLDKMNKGEKTW